MHFMNPVPVMPLVEIIRGIATTDAVRPHAGSISLRRRGLLFLWASGEAHCAGSQVLSGVACTCARTKKLEVREHGAGL